MAVDFKNSQTKENLMRAFAGESQARNRYTLAAQQAEQENLHVINEVFLFTANQEKEHAEVFYNFLKGAAGETIEIDGGYPVDLSDNIVDLLRYAHHNEYEEFQDVYQKFGDKAKEEGFLDIASTFYNIAKIEQTHGDRFEEYAQLIEKGELFVSQVEVKWMCLNCGFIYEGKEVPMSCPVCHHDRGYFIRLEMKKK